MTTAREALDLALIDLAPPGSADVRLSLPVRTRPKEVRTTR